MMKFITVFFVCAVVLTATAYPQSRSNNKLKNKPKSSRQELPPATPTPVVDKTVVSQNTSQVLTIASNSTPSVVSSSTQAPKAAGTEVSSVAPPASVVTTVTTVAPPKASTGAPKNATATTPKPDEDDEDEDSSEEEEDAEEGDVEEGDFEGPPGPPGPPGPGPEDDSDFEDEEDDDDDRAADQSSSPENVQIKPSKKNKKGVNEEAKIRETSGGIDAYVPGYVTDQGEVLVPIDTLERGLQYTIISDRFVSIPQKKSHLQRKPVYLYRQEPAKVKPAVQTDAEESSEEEAPPQVFPIKETETSVIFATKAQPTNDTQIEEQSPGNTSQSSESQEDEDDQVAELKTAAPVNPPLGAVPATRPTGEDDEDEVIGVRRSDNRVFRRNFYQPSRHFAYSPQFDYINNVHDNRRLDYPVVNDPYSANFYRSYGRVQPLRYNGPFTDATYEDSLEDFGRSDFDDY